MFPVSFQSLLKGFDRFGVNHLTGKVVPCFDWAIVEWICLYSSMAVVREVTHKLEVMSSICPFVPPYLRWNRGFVCASSNELEKNCTPLVEDFNFWADSPWIIQSIFFLWDICLHSYSFFSWDAPIVVCMKNVSLNLDLYVTL